MTPRLRKPRVGLSVFNLYLSSFYKVLKIQHTHWPGQTYSRVRVISLRQIWTSGRVYKDSLVEAT